MNLEQGNGWTASIPLYRTSLTVVGRGRGGCSRASLTGQACRSRGKEQSQGCGINSAHQSRLNYFRVYVVRRPSSPVRLPRLVYIPRREVRSQSGPGPVQVRSDKVGPPVILHPPPASFLAPPPPLREKVCLGRYPDLHNIITVILHTNHIRVVPLGRGRKWSTNQ